MPLVTTGVSAQPTYHLGLAVGSRDDAGGIRPAEVLQVSAGVTLGRTTLRWRVLDVVTITTSVDTVQSDPNRYYWDTFNNGQRRCRDRSNGQFVADSLCSRSSGPRERATLEEMAGTGVEAAFAVLNGRPTASLGGGIRYGVSGEITPYGLIQLTWAPLRGSHFFLNGTAGGAMMTGGEIGYSFRVR